MIDMLDYMLDYGASEPPEAHSGRLQEGMDKMSFSTIDQMKKAAVDYENFCADDYSIPERALFWASISQALAAERQVAALERIADLLTRIRISEIDKEIDRIDAKIRGMTK